MSSILTSEVVNILKVGISGLIFLLAYFGYRLFSQELTKPSPNTKALNSARFFMKISLCLAVLAATYSVSELIIWHNDSQRDRAIENCQNALTRLKTTSRLPDTSLDTLRAAIEGHLTTCSSIGK